MKLDFHNDNRLMQPTPAGGGGSGVGGSTGKSPLDKDIDQYQNAYNQALAAGNTAKATKILQDSIAFARKKSLVENGSAAQLALGDLSKDIEAKRQNSVQDQGISAAQAMIDLSKGKNSADLAALNAQENAIFGAKMQGPTMMQGFYNSIKMFGGIIDGLCHTHIEEWADKKLDEIKYPTMNRESIAQAKTDISSTDAEARVNESSDHAQNDLQNASPERVGRFFDALKNQVNGGASPAPTAGPSVAEVTTSVAKLVTDHTLSADQGRAVLTDYKAAAANSGNAATVDTQADMNLIDGMLKKVLTNMQQRQQVEAKIGLTPSTQVATGPVPAPAQP